MVVFSTECSAAHSSVVHSISPPDSTCPLLDIAAPHWFAMASLAVPVTPPVPPLLVCHRIARHSSALSSFSYHRVRFAPIWRAGANGTADPPLGRMSSRKGSRTRWKEDERKRQESQIQERNKHWCVSMSWLRRGYALRCNVMHCIVMKCNALCSYPQLLRAVH